MELSRDREGAVLVCQTGGNLKSCSALPDSALRIEEYCTQNGLTVVQGFPTTDSDRDSPTDFADGEVWELSIAARWREKYWPIGSVIARARSGIG